MGDDWKHVLITERGAHDATGTVELLQDALSEWAERLNRWATETVVPWWESLDEETRQAILEERT